MFLQLEKEYEFNLHGQALQLEYTVNKQDQTFGIIFSQYWLATGVVDTLGSDQSF